MELLQLANTDFENTSYKCTIDQELADYVA